MQTFSNPLLPVGQDPFVLFKDGWYYYCHAATPIGWTPIFISKSRTLLGLRTAKRVPVWTPVKEGEASKDLWAPELHYIRGKWYIYFAAWDGIPGKLHHMYVLESRTQDPQGEYVMKGKIDTDPPGQWAIDGTIFEESGRLYYVWSGKNYQQTAMEPQKLFISEMENPWTRIGAQIFLSEPTLPWEQKGPHPVNEGPQILKRHGSIFIIYSASSALTDDYCLGMLINKTGDILNPKAWIKYPEAVFSKTSDMFGPGHASFITSSDGKEDWIIYHSSQFTGSGFARKVNAQPFVWDENGMPYFSEPISFDRRLAVPSGDAAQEENKARNVVATLSPFFQPLRRVMPAKIQVPFRKQNTG